MRVFVAAALLVLSLAASARADDSDFGPDWQVCIAAVPSELPNRLAACNRMISGGKLSTLDLARAFSNRGRTYHLLGQREQAFADYLRAQQLDPKRVKPYFYLGLLYQEEGRLADALEQYDKAFALDPQLAELACRRGVVFQGLFRFDEALAAFEAAVQASATDVCSMSNLVELYDARGRVDEIFPMIDRAMAESGGGTAELYRLRAEIYRLRKRELELALADLNKAVALQPGFYDNILDRGIVLTELGRYNEALQDLDQAAAIAPNFSDSYFWRANAKIRSGAYKSALADCEYGLTLSPDDSRCQVLALRAAFLIGDFAKAANYADALPKGFFPSAPFFKAAALFGAGKSDAAAAALQAYTAAEPNDPYGWLWLYLVDRRLGKEGPAEIKALAARRDAWPTPIFRFIAGMASADDVLAAAAAPHAMISRMRTGEANYYLGALAAIGGDAAKAEAFMRASLAAGYAQIDVLDSIPVYKDSNAVELGLAANPPGGSL